MVDANDPSDIGAAYAVTATVTRSGSVGTPTGTVSISDGTSSCTTGNLGGSASAPTASCNLASSTGGAKTITATYAGDGNFNGSSGTTDHTVSNLVGTTMTATDPAATNVGTSYTVSATVTPASGTTRPAGTVSFTDGVGGTCSTNAPTDGAGVSSVFACSINNTTAGNLTITATYTPSATFAPATATTAHTVNKYSTNLTVSDTPDPTVIGQPYTVTGTVVRGGGTATPTGTVTVADGADTCTITLAPTATAGTASGTCAFVSTVSASGRTLSGTYNGDATFNTDTDTTGHSRQPRQLRHGGDEQRDPVGVRPAGDPHRDRHPDGPEHHAPDGHRDLP